MLAAIPLPQRLIAEVALGSGVRKGEQWALRLEDVDTTSFQPSMIVRYGGRKKSPTKGNRARRVPLFGRSLRAMREWLAILPSLHSRNPLGLVFPGRNGEERNVHSVPFPEANRIASVIGRPFRWHDWRHTCATSLLNGWWGDEPWSIEALCVFLGHSSVTITEKYGRLAEELAFSAATQRDRSLGVGAPSQVERGESGGVGRLGGGAIDVGPREPVAEGALDAALLSDPLAGGRVRSEGRNVGGDSAVVQRLGRKAGGQKKSRQGVTMDRDLVNCSETSAPVARDSRTACSETYISASGPSKALALPSPFELACAEFFEKSARADARARDFGDAFNLACAELDTLNAELLSLKTALHVREAEIAALKARVSELEASQNELEPFSETGTPRFERITGISVGVGGQIYASISPRDVTSHDLAIARTALYSLVSRGLVTNSSEGQEALAAFFATHRAASTFPIEARYRQAIGILSDVHALKARVEAMLDEHAELGGKR